MPIDPYAALHALLRAEAVRNSPSAHTNSNSNSTPSPTPTPHPDTAAPAQVEEGDQGAEKRTGQRDN